MNQIAQTRTYKAIALAATILLTASAACVVPVDSETEDAEVSLDSTQQSLCATISQALISAQVSNTSPGGTVNRSGVYSSSYEAWKAFDQNGSTRWLSNMYTSSVWIDYSWNDGSSKVVRTYQIKYNNGSCCQQRGPKNWTLQGFNGSSWTVIDTVVNQTNWNSNNTRNFTVDSPGEYKKYRIKVTADNYNNANYPITLVSIGDIQMYGSTSSSLIPDMTSNTSPSGSVTRSGIYSSSYEGWKAFDQNGSTRWLSNMYTSSVWLGYEWGGGASKTVHSYEVKYNNGSCCEQRGPKNWQLQGFNGSSWVTVDTVTNQTGWNANPNRTFIVDSPSCYTKYRLRVTADNYNHPNYPITLVSIGELKLHGYGSSCIPDSCQANDCGFVDNGCGSSMYCGPCESSCPSGYEACGPFVCCPSGSKCNGPCIFNSLE